jgi:hypothetical protein
LSTTVTTTDAGEADMFLRSAILVAVIGFSSGCNLFPQWMHPGNLWELNGQDPPAGEGMYFSVPDPDTADPFLNATDAARPVRDEFTTFGELDSAG